MTKHILTFILVCFCSVHSRGYAQQNIPAYNIATQSKTFYPASAQAAELFQKQPEEIDYATGKATIRIPLYEIQAGTLRLPISLTYVTRGIQTEQKNGLVALGWQLEAEPIISRQVRGLPDEQSFLWDKNNLETNTTNYQIKIGQGKCDVEEDLFFFRLAGASGQFALQMTDQHAFIPRIFGSAPYKVTLGDAETKVKDAFENQLRMTDLNGNRYLFGKDAQSREMTEIVNQSRCVTAWKACEILSPDGEKIQFEYLNNFQLETVNPGYDYYAIEDDYPPFDAHDPGTPPHPGYWKGIGNTARYYYVSNVTLQPDGTRKPTFSPWSGNTIQYTQGLSRVAVRPISRILFPGGSIIFTYNAVSHTLETIQVKSLTETVRTISLKKSNQTYSRLLLTEVSVADGQGKIAEKYTMNYYPGQGYDPATKAVDYWGLYNGKTGNTDLVPQQTVTARKDGNILTFSLGGANKEGDPDLAQTFSLSSVIWPTGGKTEYSYGLSKICMPQSGKDFIWGGSLRINRIKDTAPGSYAVIRDFEYRNSQRTDDWGSTRFPLCHAIFNQRMEKYYVNQQNLGRRVNYHLHSHVNTLTADQEVYFDTVREIVNGGSVIHHFNNYAHWEPNFYTNTDYLDIIDEPLQNSALLSDEVRREFQREGGILLKATTGGRPSHFDALAKLKRLTLVEGSFTQNMVDYSMLLRDIYQNSYRHESVDLTTLDGFTPYTTTTTCSLQGELTETEEGTYIKGLPREISATTSKGNKRKVTYMYPFDFSGGVYSKMVSANDLSRPVETRYYLDNLLQKTVKYNYTADSSNKGYNLTSVQESTNEGNTTFRSVETYSGLLRCGQPSQLTRKDGSHVCLLWGYGGKHLIASIENLTIAHIESAGINPETLAAAQTIEENVYTLLDGLRNQYPMAHVSTYRYRPLIGLIKQTNPDGTSISYEYDSLGRLLKTKDNQNKTINQYEYNEINK